MIFANCWVIPIFFSMHTNLLQWRKARIELALSGTALQHELILLRIRQGVDILELHHVVLGVESLFLVLLEHDRFVVQALVVVFFGPFSPAVDENFPVFDVHFVPLFEPLVDDWDCFGRVLLQLVDEFFAHVSVDEAD